MEKMYVNRSFNEGNPRILFVARFARRAAAKLPCHWSIISIAVAASRGLTSVRARECRGKPRRYSLCVTQVPPHTHCAGSNPRKSVFLTRNHEVFHHMSYDERREFAQASLLYMCSIWQLACVLLRRRKRRLLA